MAEKEILKQKFATGQVPTGEDFAQLIDTVGKPGADGTQGPKGEPGADGFPTEEQWNELVARVEALEAVE